MRKGNLCPFYDARIMASPRALRFAPNFSNSPAPQNSLLVTPYLPTTLWQ
ncbi:MAG: hypothetical protein DFNUSKGM_001108 [Candidatus Fervidibacter sacchari]